MVLILLTEFNTNYDESKNDFINLDLLRATLTQKFFGEITIKS